MATLTERLHEQCRTLITQRGMFMEDLLAALRLLAGRTDGMVSELIEQYGGLNNLLLNGLPFLQWDFSQGVFSTEGMSFTRSGPATVADHRGTTWTCLTNEMRIQGARRVENLITGDGVANFGVIFTTVTPLAIAPPPGRSQSSVRAITATAVNNTHSTAFGVVYAARPYVLWGEFKANGLTQVLLTQWDGATDRRVCFNLTGAGSIFSTLNGATGTIVSLGDGWYRCTMFVTSGAGTGDFGISPAVAGDRVYLGDGVNGIAASVVQVELAAPNQIAASEYVPRGVLASPFNGYFADGVQYFPTERHVNYTPNSTFTGQVGNSVPPTMSMNAGLGTVVVAGTGVEDGQTFVDFDFAVNNVSGGTVFPLIGLVLPNQGGPAALPGQTWFASARARFITRTGTNGAAWQIQLRETRADGSFLAVSTGTTVSFADQVCSVNRTMSNPECARAEVLIAASCAPGLTDNCRIRVSVPSLNRDLVAPYIPTSGFPAAGPFYSITPAPAGVLIEEPATNGIRNSLLAGLVAGSPGTPPTNWSIGDNGAGLTRTISGPFIENGLTCFDVRFVGTTLAATELFITPEPGTAVVAANGQTWQGSIFVRMSAGSTANFTGISLATRGVDGVGTALTLAVGADIRAQIASGPLSRVVTPVTTADPATAAVQTYLRGAFASGVAIDITFRIAAPQLEREPFITSFIPTTSGAGTRAEDALIINPIPWYNQLASTFFYEGTILNGSIVAFPTLFCVGIGTFPTQEVTAFGLPPNTVSQETKVGGVNTLVTPSAVIPLGVSFRQAVTVSDNYTIQAVNGVLSGTDTLGAMPSGLNRMSLGGLQARGNATGGVQTIARFRYYPSRLPDAQLQSITA